MAKIKLQPLEGFKNEWIPKRGSEGAAAWDLFAAEDVMLKAFCPTLVPTKFNIELPEGYAGLVLPRSGNALKKGILIPNSPGLIDQDYRGHAQVIMMWVPAPDMFGGQNLGGFFMVKSGDKIAQLMLVKYEPQEWEVVDGLSETGRGAGGFGSTDSGSQTEPGTGG